MIELKQLCFVLSEGATLPTRAHPGDAGLDLYPTVQDDGFELGPGEVYAVPTGLRVAIPDGYVGKIEGRSGMAVDGIGPLAGVLDAGFRGEFKVILANLTSYVWTHQPGKAIAQLLVMPIALPVPVAVDDLPEADRGESGFGSTDAKTAWGGN